MAYLLFIKTQSDNIMCFSRDSMRTKLYKKGEELLRNNTIKSYYITNPSKYGLDDCYIIAHAKTILKNML